MASVRQRGAGFTVRYRDPDGKSEEIYGFATKKDAEVAAKKIELEKVSGKLKPKQISRMTLQEFVEQEWSKTLNKEFSTLTSYENSLNKHILPIFGDMPLSAITSLEVEKWLTRLAMEPGWRGKPLAPKTIERHANLLATILKKAKVNGFIERSPFEQIKRQKAKPSRKATPLEFSQVNVFAETFTNQNSILIWLMFHTGMRSSEALGLTWDRIDFDSRIIKIDRQLSRNHSNGIFTKLKTSKSERSVPLSDALSKLLTSHRELHGLGPHQLLTKNRLGGIYTYKNASQQFASIARGLGLPAGSGMHMLRHTFASRALNAGVNIKAVQEFLGHESITETLDTYSHLMESDHSNFLEKMNEIFELEQSQFKAKNRSKIQAV